VNQSVYKRGERKGRKGVKGGGTGKNIRARLEKSSAARRAHDLTKAITRKASTLVF